MSVFVLDCLWLVRLGVRALLGRSDCAHVVGEAADAASAIIAIDDLRPGVVMFDPTQPGSGGLGVVARFRRLSPESRVLVFTGCDEPGLIGSALDLGVDGYVLKQSTNETLFEAIRTVASGQTFLDPALRHLRTSKTMVLSEREQQVLRSIALGYSIREAASTLSVTVKTAQAFLDRATGKLGLGHRADVVRYALACGWLAPKAARRETAGA